MCRLSLLHIPLDLMCMILGHLDRKSIKRLYSTCRAFHRLIRTYQSAFRFHRKKITPATSDKDFFRLFNQMERRLYGVNFIVDDSFIRYYSSTTLEAFGADLSKTRLNDIRNVHSNICRSFAKFEQLCQLTEPGGIESWSITQALSRSPISLKSIKITLPDSRHDLYDSTPRDMWSLSLRFLRAVGGNPEEVSLFHILDHPESGYEPPSTFSSPPSNLLTANLRSLKVDLSYSPEVKDHSDVLMSHPEVKWLKSYATSAINSGKLVDFAIGSFTEDAASNTPNIHFILGYPEISSSSITNLNITGMEVELKFLAGILVQSSCHFIRTFTNLDLDTVALSNSEKYKHWSSILQIIETNISLRLPGAPPPHLRLWYPMVATTEVDRAWDRLGGNDIHGRLHDLFEQRCGTYAFCGYDDTWLLQGSISQDDQLAKLEDVELQDLCLSCK